jgi:aspartyl-tRNA(Asn)/glutamyl-tRNA(Gln) amidotransferase subunit C
VIDREEVLHVARLARLQLSEQEVQSMAGELSAVLDHIAKIGELDLEDVAPTSHVVEVTGALRPDEPVDSLPREVVLAQAPAVSGDGFLVPAQRVAQPAAGRLAETGTRAGGACPPASVGPLDIPDPQA